MYTRVPLGDIEGISKGAPVWYHCTLGSCSAGAYILSPLEEGSRDTCDGLPKSHVISRTGENKWGSRTLL